MRNRVYITSIIENTEGFENETNAKNKSFSFPYKNVLIFVPWLHALFLNGKRYGSMNEVKNDTSVSSVFELGICTENNINSIKLVQRELAEKFDIISVVIGGQYFIPTSNPNEYNVYMSPGDRMQIFLSYNNTWSWKYKSTNDNSVTVDRNNIIHALAPNSNPQIFYLYIRNTNKVMTLRVKVFASNNVMKDILANAMVANIMSNGGNSNMRYDDFIGRIDSEIGTREAIERSHMESNIHQGEARV